MPEMIRRCAMTKTTIQGQAHQDDVGEMGGAAQAVV